MTSSSSVLILGRSWTSTGRSRKAASPGSGLDSTRRQAFLGRGKSSLGLFTPKVQAGNNILARLVFVSVQNLQFAKGKQVSTVIMIIRRKSQGLISGGFQDEIFRGGGDHLSCARMQHPDILSSHNVDQLARLDVTYFDKARLERQNIWVAEGEGLGCAFPLDLPVGSCSPAVAVDEKAEIGVVEEELAVETFDVDGPNVFLAGDEIK